MAAGVFYSILCRIITIAAGLDPFGIKIVLKTLFPVIFQRYWYFSAYVIILIASPFLNIILKKLTKKQHFWLCVIMLTLFTVVPTIFKGTWLGGQIGNENYLKSFIALYITAGYVKFYGIGKIKKRSVYLWVALMIYNYARFENPFEFGQSYQLTALDVSSVSLFGNFNFFNTVGNVLYYLVGCADLKQLVDLGTFLTFPILLYSVVSLGHESVRNRLKKERFSSTLAVMLITALIIVYFDVAYSPLLVNRYRLDYV